MVTEAGKLIEEQCPAGHRDPVIDPIETILVYKFPKLTRAEIQTMLHLPETDLKKTRFYQEAFGEGEEAGELALVLRQLKRRLGGLTARQQGQIEQLPGEDLGALGEALLDFVSAADLDDWLQVRRGV